jgi:phosphoribosylaminoimidazole-succinocarboxamide synthase
MTFKEQMGKTGTIPGVTPAFKGKVRDIYDLGDKLLIVASDRISAYDSVLPTLIPGKGIILNTISAAWFEWFSDIPNHLISTDIREFPEAFRKYECELRGRSMLVRKAKRIELECIVRGYITGSGWKEFKRSGEVCGIRLPQDTMLSGKLEKPILTPSTKAESGHDENITFETAASIAGRDTIERIRRMSIDIYERASGYAASRGIIIADTKFEFGLVGEEIILIDEVLTPDSSRFWLEEEYEPGRPQRSLDKQFVRDYLDMIGWDHSPPAPDLPEDIVEKTVKRYRLALERLFPDTNIERYMS